VTSRLVDARTELARHEAYCLRTAQRSSDRDEVWSRSLLQCFIATGLSPAGGACGSAKCWWDTKASVPPYQAVCRSRRVAGTVSLAACSHGPEAVVMGQVGWARARVSEAIRVVFSLERLQARSPCQAPCQAGPCLPGRLCGSSGSPRCDVSAGQAGSAGRRRRHRPCSHWRGCGGRARPLACEGPHRAHPCVRAARRASLRFGSSGHRQAAGRRARGACLRHAQSGNASSAHALRGPSSACQTFTLHALCAQVPGKSAAAAPDATSAPAADLAVRASARRSLALLPARTHCAGPALLARPSRYTRCARRCPASPLPQRRTPPARQLQTSRCVPPADAVWLCFQRACTARAQLCLAEVHAICAVRAGARQVRCRSAGRHQRASCRPRGACLRQTQSGVASCAHALRGPSSAWQKFTLYALCAQVPGKSATIAPDATSAPAADLAVRASATRSLALLPACTLCAGPALLGRSSRYMRCARRCSATPLPQRQTLHTRQPQRSW